MYLHNTCTCNCMRFVGDRSPTILSQRENIWLWVSWMGTYVRWWPQAPCRRRDQTLCPHMILCGEREPTVVYKSCMYMYMYVCVYECLWTCEKVCISDVSIPHTALSCLLTQRPWRSSSLLCRMEIMMLPSQRLRYITCSHTVCLSPTLHYMYYDVNGKYIVSQ